MNSDQKDDSLETPRKRGRPRIRRRLNPDRNFRCYEPRCQVSSFIETVCLLPEEIEILRLIDLEGMEQEEAAAVLGISRRTVWKDLHEARRKIADALIHGKSIEVVGCKNRNTDLCPKDENVCPKGFGSCKGRNNIYDD